MWRQFIIIQNLYPKTCGVVSENRLSTALTEWDISDNILRGHVMKDEKDFPHCDQAWIQGGKLPLFLYGQVLKDKEK